MRVTSTLLVSTGMARSRLSRCTLTLATLVPCREPATSFITDFSESTRSTVGLFSPSAKAMASSMVDLPDPLGPDMETSPGTSFTVVLRNPNDLNPYISTFSMCIIPVL